MYIIGGGVATRGAKDAGIKLLDKAFDLSKSPKGTLKGVSRKIWQTAEDVMTQTGKPLAEVTPEEMLKGFFGTVRRSAQMGAAEAAQVGAKEAVVPAAKGAVKSLEDKVSNYVKSISDARIAGKQFTSIEEEYIAAGQGLLQKIKVPGTPRPITVKAWRGIRPLRKGQTFASDAGDLGAGIYYSSSKSFAKAYGAIGKPLQKTLEFKNPIYLTGKEASELGEAYKTVRAPIKERLIGANKLRQDLLDAGYDGIIAKGYEGAETTTYVVLRSTLEQEKTALKGLASRIKGVEEAAEKVTLKAEEAIKVGVTKLEDIPKDWDAMFEADRLLLAEQAGVAKTTAKKPWEMLTKVQQDKIMKAARKATLEVEEAPTGLQPVRQVAQTETEEQALARISQRLAEWRPQREEFEPMLKAFRAKQLTAGSEAELYAKGLKVGEYEAYLEGLKAMKSVGEAPTPYRKAIPISAEEKDLLVRIIDRELPDFPNLSRYDVRLHAKEGLDRLLTEGKLPEPAQAELLERVFGFSFMENAFKRQRSLGFKILENIYTIMNVPRSLKASWDLSAPLRQGQVLIPGHPKESASAFKWMLKALGSEKDALFMDDLLHGRVGKLVEAGLTEDAAIKANVKATRALDHHLFLHDLRYGGKISEREEMFISRFGGKYGAMAKKWTGVEFSERTYATFLNKQRSDVFNHIADGWEKSGKYLKPDGSFNKELWDEDLVELSRFVNRATGRGELWKGEYQMAAKPFQTGSPAALLNIGFFAPRLATSRPLLVGSLFSQSAAVRKQAARDLTAFWATQATVMSLVALSSDDVSLELDPRSAQSWKLRYKDTYYDISAGFQPLIRYTANFFAGRKSQSGWISEREPGDTTWRFAQSKFTPIVGSIYASLSGKLFSGEEIPEGWAGVPTLLNETLTPLSIDALVESGMEYGTIQGVILATPELLGAGVSTYNTAGTVTMDYWSMRSQLEDVVSKWKDARLARDPKKLSKLEEDHPELNMQYDPSLGDYFSMTLRTLRSHAARKGGINELSQQINEIQLNPDLSRAEKKRIVEELERHKDLIATQAILEVEGLYDTKWELMDLPDVLGGEELSKEQPIESRPGLAPGLESFRD